MKLSLIIMLWIIGQKISGGPMYWMAYFLFCLAAMIGDSK